MHRAVLLLAAAAVLAASPLWARSGPVVLKPASFKQYIEAFNAGDNELYKQYYPNSAAWAFLQDNIPLFECPDKDMEEIYYFRWWTYRKHIKETPDGFIITEFLPNVPWAGKHNSISCAADHHFHEGRWIHDARFLDDYSVFWFRKGGDPRRYSFSAADAVWSRYLVNRDGKLAVDLLPDLIRNWDAWDKDHRDSNRLFWQSDGADGGEVSIAGYLSPGAEGYRATINSYMYGDALAIAQIADLAGKKDVAADFRGRAAEIKRLVQDKLWDPEAVFFKVIPRNSTVRADVREEHGYIPWYFNLPDPDKSAAWKQLMDPKGFKAPFGPTTAEQRHPKFEVSYQGHECQWNGPGWPFATSFTLTAMANLLNNYKQDAVTRSDYFDVLQTYTKSHRLKLEDGRTVPWIDENLNPFTGDWLARTRLKTWENDGWSAGKGGVERGKDYNHSTYCDLIITGLVGLRPRADDVVEVNPLVPEGRWDYFCLDNVLYQGRVLTIIYDRTGKRYNRGAGLQVFSDGKRIAKSATLKRVTGKLAAGQK